jgi:hydroxymethylpyrimidine pyrophosphatase-like HAD family hydrolase
MTQSFLAIPFASARRLRLLMTDVDGTLTSDGEHFEPIVAETIAGLHADGIVVGLVSGRTLPRLDRIASSLGIAGPLIAENGGVARLAPGGDLVDLGHSRDRALAAAARLRSLYPDLVRELDDNSDRLVDVTVSVDGLSVVDLKRLVPGVQLLDSGYMVHLMADGISKGATLTFLLDRIGDRRVAPGEVMVCGDSVTDVSLFQSFANSVLIHNPLLSPEQQGAVAGMAAYEAELPVEIGFVQVAKHVLQLRRLGPVPRPNP